MKKADQLTLDSTARFSQGPSRCLTFAVVSLILACTRPVPDGMTVEERIEPNPDQASGADDGTTTLVRAQAPPHVAELRRLAYAGRQLMGRKAAEELLVQYPDDPWVLADAALVSPRLERDAMLIRALELAKEPSLRAEIRYYVALLIQSEQGLVAGRDAVAAALAEFPLPAAKRNLELIVGHKSSSPEDEEAVRATCRRALQSNDDYVEDEHRKCAAVRVGDTLWALHVRVMSVWYARRVVHEWYFVDPRIPEGLKMYGDDGPEHDPDEAECRNYEVLAIDAPYGIEGGVTHTEFVTRGPREYLLFRCTTGTVERNAAGAVIVVGPSSYTRVCELDSGWCTRPIYTREVLSDGTVREATVQIVDDFIVVTPTDGAPRRDVLP